MRHPKSKEGKANIKEAANRPEKIEKIRAALLLRKQNAIRTDEINRSSPLSLVVGGNKS
jgi:hypothetical protein